MGGAENPEKLGLQLPRAALMAMIMPETGVHPEDVSLILLAAYAYTKQLHRSDHRGQPQWETYVIDLNDIP